MASSSAAEPRTVNPLVAGSIPASPANFMYAYNEIKIVHLEITERCNASCPQCARNINGGEVNQHLKNNELYLEDIQKMFPKEFIQQISHLFMCGNYGDPIVAQDTIEIFKYLREQNPNLLLSMNTNASARTDAWWADLAKAIGSNSYVVFSIDGLKDTNHIYRKGTNWDKIMSSVKAFINAGGNAHWEYIVFEHNEHQIDEAKRLADELGFKAFRIKKTGRFFSPITGKVRKHNAIIDKNGNTIELKLPKNPNWQNEGNKKLSISESTPDPAIKIPTTYDEIKDRLNPELFNYPMIEAYNKTTIECKVEKEKSVYISAEGIVQPCCWIGSSMYHWYFMYKRTQIWKYINKVGINKINAKETNLKDIVEGEYFKLIKESWDKPTCSEGKLTICAKTCGNDLETFSKQYA